jgi:hypothetical protein
MKKCKSSCFIFFSIGSATPEGRPGGGSEIDKGTAKK